MRRREVVSLMGFAAAAWPLAARAQQTNIPTVGVLVLGSPDPTLLLKAFREGLQNVGYTDGQNIRLEIRTAGGDASLLPKLAAELVRLKVDVLVAYQTPAVTAAKQATSQVPIVMVGAEALRTGLIASLARPGGNITGVSRFGPEFGAKNIELIREVLPSARRVAVLANATDPFTKPYLAEIEAAARTAGVEVAPIMLRPGDKFDAAFEDMRRTQADAVIVQPSLLRKDAADLALKYRLPSFSHVRQLAAIGGLMSYSAKLVDQVHRSAVYVDKILKGDKPADLPVEQPTKLELVINLKTAKALGLTVPTTLLARADEVIE